tara:strand:+ start:71 stop:241 length:171 start_codon:yes stop_codon:yes gene_type:complete
MSDGYEAKIQDRAQAFKDALDGAGRITVHTPNALGEWDVQNFSPAAVKHILTKEGS